MATIGSIINESLSNGFIVEPFKLRFMKNTGHLKNPREQRISINQLSTGSFVEIQETTGVTISLIGKTELTLVGAGSADDNYYDDETVTITYKSNDGITHNATMTFNTTTTTEVAFTKFGTSSDGSKYVDGVTAVTDFYCLLTMVTSKVTQAGETIGLGSTGVLTYGVIQAAATAAVAADIHGIGDVFVRGLDDTASLQAKPHVLVYFTPWGEQKTAGATTGADATVETRFLGADGSTLVADFYRILTWTTDTVPAATKNAVICDADANPNGGGGDVYGMIEEGIKESLHSRFFAAPNRITYIGGIETDFPEVATSGIKIQIGYTPKGHPHAVIEEHTILGQHDDPLRLQCEPDTDMTFKVADVTNAATGNFLINILYGKLRTAAAELVVGAV